jgi:hypothetical protein
MNEVLEPHLLDQRSAIERQFQGMTDTAFTYEDFEATRKNLINIVNSSLSKKDRSFLLTFKRGNPDWDLFPVAGLKNLPAVQWKLMNIQNLKKSNPDKHTELIHKLESLLKL